MWAKLKHASNSIRIQVLLLIAGFAFALVLSNAAIKAYQETGIAKTRLFAEATALASFTARTLEGQFELLDPSEIEAVMASIKERPGVVDVYAVDVDRILFFGDDQKVANINSHEGAQLMYRAMREKQRVLFQDHRFVSVAEPLFGQTAVVGALMLCYAIPSFYSLAFPIFMTSLFGSLPVLAIGLLLALALVRRTTAPLENLAAAAKEVSNGNLSVTLSCEGPREIRHLSDAFSTMLDRLRNSIERISTMAYIDHTTQLPNREYFRRELERSVSNVVRHDTIGALLFLDLDGFKQVNDTYGHDIGDQLLTEFSERVAGSLRFEDLLASDINSKQGTNDVHTPHVAAQMAARLGGDEFTILLEDLAFATDAAVVSNRILELIKQPFHIDGREIRIGASIGIAVFPLDGTDSQTILKHADAAMYAAKNNGKNNYRFFNDEIQALSETDAVIDEVNRRQLENNMYLSKQGLSRVPSLDDLLSLPELSVPSISPDHEIGQDEQSKDLKAS